MSEKMDLHFDDLDELEPLGRNQKVPLRYALETIQNTHNIETPICSHRRSLSIWRRVIFNNFRTSMTLTLTVYVRKYFNCALFIDLYPHTNFQQQQEKKLIGRTSSAVS